MDLPFSRILITSDGSENARAGVEAGFQLASRLGVTPTVICVSSADPDLSSSTGLPRWVAAEFELLQQEARDQGIEVDPLHEDGDPGTKIVEASRDFDLIVMASKGRGKVLQHLFGHICNQIQREADIPVMVVKT